MKKKIFYFLFVLIVLIVVSGCDTTEVPEVNEENNALAQCLTEKGVKMYGTDWCGSCKKQKEAFGDSFQYVDYVNCDLNQQKCQEAGVRGYPTWKIDGENYLGKQDLNRLASLSGC